MRLISILFLGILIVLGNLSGQSKSFVLLKHVVSHHAVHADHHHTGTHHENKKHAKHHHDADFAFLSGHIGVVPYSLATIVPPATVSTLKIYLPENKLGLASVSQCIFRPPIA